MVLSHSQLILDRIEHSLSPSPLCTSLSHKCCEQKLIPTPKQYDKGPLKNIIATTEHIHKMFLDPMHGTIWQKIKIKDNDH